MEPYRLLDLFSGIGGFSLGLERSGGFKTVAFCEIEPFPRRVLAKHWPGVPTYDDVRTLTAERLTADGIGVDAICGGFPCQDISTAGKGAGLDGERSGLWREYARIVGELRPRYVIVENVAALLGRGLDRVLGDLAEIGYDAEWHCIPASAVGAPHIRDRVWVVANAQHPNADCLGSHPTPEYNGRTELCHEQGSYLESVRAAVSNRHGERELQPEGGLRIFWRWPGDGRGWPAEPAMDRMAYGVPDGVDRLKSLGNAVVPQIPELIGRAIIAAEHQRAAA